MTTGTTEPTLTLAAAVKASGVSLSTLRRHLAAGRIAGASRTANGWNIPVSGLIAAGYVVRTTPADDTPSPAPAAAEPTPTTVVAGLDALRDENSRLRTEVVRLEAEAEAQRRHLADLQKALDVLARALPAPSEPTPNAEVTRPAGDTPTSVEPMTPHTAAVAPKRRWWQRRPR